jgi:hypothetical protein
VVAYRWGHHEESIDAWRRGCQVASDDFAREHTTKSCGTRPRTMTTRAGMVRRVRRVRGSVLVAPRELAESDGAVIQKGKGASQMSGS